jgi:hypothetical protein
MSCVSADAIAVGTGSGAALGAVTTIGEEAETAASSAMTPLTVVLVAAKARQIFSGVRRRFADPWLMVPFRAVLSVVADRRWRDADATRSANRLT